MNKEFATVAKERALSAIRNLNDIIKKSDDWESQEMRILKKGVGMAIIRIEIEILREIYTLYPDLDDLR